MPLDLAFTVVVTFAIFFLGSAVYFNDRKSATNTLFFFIALVTVFWALANYFSLNPYYEDTLYFIRMVLFFAAPHAILFVLFVYNFPNIEMTVRKRYETLAVTLMAIAMFSAISPYVFTGITVVNNRTIPQPGPLIPLFGAIILGSLAWGLITIIRKYRNASPDLKRRWASILWGVSISYILLILSQFVLVVVFDNSSLVVFAPLFMLPTFIGVAYATVRYQLLEAKAMVVEIMIFVLLMLTLFELLISKDIFEIILRSVLFGSFFVVGIFLLRAVLNEVSLREQLQAANEGQANLIHIINHQIKGYLSKARNIFAELLTDPSYGPISGDMKPMLEEGSRSLGEGVDFVQQVLNSSSAEKGTLAYIMEPIDFKAVVQEMFDHEKPQAAEKHLSYDLQIEDGDYQTKGDFVQLKEAVRNLITNSILYTPSGSVNVHLSRKDDKLLMTVVDTGVGLSEEDKLKLFTKGGRGKDSLKININSTGYGLSFVKAVVEAHKGRVWATSEGRGKGSTFSLELPIE